MVEPEDIRFAVSADAEAITEMLAYLAQIWVTAGRSRQRQRRSANLVLGQTRFFQY